MVLSILCYFSKESIPEALVRIGTFGSRKFPPGTKLVIRRAFTDTLSRKYFYNKDAVELDRRTLEWFVKKGYSPSDVKTLDFFGSGKGETVDLETSAVYSFSLSKGVKKFVSVGIVSDNLGKNVLPVEVRAELLEKVGREVAEWLGQGT